MSEAPSDATLAGAQSTPTGLTISFADPSAEIFGQARVVISDQASQRFAGVLAMVFCGRRVLTCTHTRIAPADLLHDERTITAGPLKLSVLEAPSRWQASFTGDDAGQGSFELELHALGHPAHFLAGAQNDLSELPESFEQACRISGKVMVDGKWIEADGLGQHGHTYRESPLSTRASLREVDAWLGEDLSISLRATRKVDGKEQDTGAISAFLAEGASPEPLRLDEVRLSSTYDSGGLQRRAGLELWPREDSDYPRRAAGEALCGGTVVVDLIDRSTPPPSARSSREALTGTTRMQWQCAFLEWHMEGQRGLGPYSILQSV